MKNKSSRHKEENTFRFQPFAERISNINVDIFHRVAHAYETLTEEDEECNFHQTIDKWDVLNLTESYNLFKRDVKSHTIITLPQLLHSKDVVVEVLLKHLKTKNPLCLQPLLDLTVALAKDLRNDFYPYYPDILIILIELLNTNDTEQLEWTFQCLAYLFKFLWRALIKDINTVFKALLPLLSENYPEYINNFAAESFAFVARKVKDKDSFLELVLKAVKKHKDGISGCGRLLFEVVKGINGQFHSCADSIIPFLLESISNDKFPQDELFEILQCLITHIVNNIHPNKGSLLWNIYYVLLNKWTDKWNVENDKCIDKLLILIGQTAEYRHGKFLEEPVQLTKELKNVMLLDGISQNVLINSVKLSIILLISKNIKLAQEQSSLLTRTVLGLKDEYVFLYFIEHVSTYVSFDPLILPTFLKRCVENNLKNTYLIVLTKLILQKSPLCENGIKHKKWCKYKLDFGIGNSLIENKIKELITSEKPDDKLCAIIILPHLNIELRSFKELLFIDINSICKKLNAEESVETIKNSLFLLQIILDTFIHISESNELEVLKDVILSNLLPLCANMEFIIALNIVDLYLTSQQFSKEILNRESLELIHEKLCNNLSSPYHKIRLLTTHIYSLFENSVELTPADSDEAWNIFSICYRVESINTQVDTYREQLQLLEKFNGAKQQIAMCSTTIYKSVPLRFLCGVLYINFQLLWEPVTKIIASIAHGIDVKDFWVVFVEELKNVVTNIRNRPVINDYKLSSDYQFIIDMFEEFYALPDKSDFANYRLLLWKVLTEIPDVAESKTRDVSELFLNFIENEYMKSNSEMAHLWNIKQNTEEVVDEEMEVDEDDETEKIKKELKKPIVSTESRKTFKTMLQHLTVLSKVRSPKSMYREPELNKLYFDFLSHKNPLIQKLALDCVMTYKYKHLVPYQQNLYGLIDNKNFKNELISFRVDQESSIIEPEHRDELIPVVMKIVFSKMVAKAGMRTGGKSSGQFRRNLILRFLSGCKHNEMMLFIHMAFKYYVKYMNEDIENIVNNVDLEKFIPPKRLQSTINLLTVVLEQFGNLMNNELLGFLLKVLLTIGAFLKGAFNNYGSVHAGYFAVLRNLRTSSIMLIERFFNHFEFYPWSKEEINAVFDIFIWPYLDKLNIEGIHSPTTLLKLLCLWGTNPHYFPLLAKHQSDNKELNPLNHMMQLLTNPKSHITVYNLIIEMLEKMLTLSANEEEEEDGKQQPLQIDNLLSIETTILERLTVAGNNLNYGSCILLPHVPSILGKLKLKLQNKHKIINRRELLILSRLSELIWEADTSDTILELLYPIVLKKCSYNSEEALVSQYVTTIYNLLQNVNCPEKHLRQIAPLFAYVSIAPCRKLLCAMLTTMSKSNDELILAKDLITRLNAYDAKWVDQPDFETRLAAFKEITDLMEKNVLSVEVGVLLIYNCYFMISIEKDLSLRENASNCLKQITPYLIIKYQRSPKDVSYIIDDILLMLIKKGIKNSNNDIRNECISLLGHISRECAQFHVVLRDLNKLTNKTDMEVDFFENLTHLQTHRHGRALLRITQVYKQELTAPNIRTLIHFLLPLSTHYLCNDKFTSKHNIIEGAIEAVGTICKLLPWHHYESVLKLYLSKLRYKTEYQKQMVKLIVHILDSFHFDLSKGVVDDIKQKEVVKTDTKTKEVEESKDESENLEDELNEEELDLNAEVDEEEVEIVSADDVKKPYDKITVMCKSAATRISKTIQTILLPQLHRSLAQMSANQGAHKSNQKRTRMDQEDEDLSRIPLSLALVKLLQRLPKVILDHNLPGVFMKICTFLQSQLESVRKVTRETLQKIMLTLGADYLQVLLSEMVALLSKGFQVHVLVYTIHAVLSSLKDTYKIGDIDKILLSVVNICRTDLFGSLAEEKEVAKIVSKTSEAKSSKSIDTFQILAQYITDKCLMDLILPIKSVLAATHSFKMVNRAQECLKHIALGLVDNEFILLESLLKFAYGAASESIPQLLHKEKAAITDQERQKMELEKPDCFIIPKNPTNRSGYRLNNVKRNAKTNAHVLVEFGIRLCSFMLKRDKVKDDEYKPYLNPFVGIFKKCLSSQHVKLSTVTLQCLQWILKFDLPSIRDEIKEITQLLFDILHKYASAGLSKGDNFDLVVAAFKTMSVLVRDVKYHKIEAKQLKVLLLYVEQDLHDYDRQAIAFGLLKAILSRKLIVTEIHPIMSKVAELSVTSELTHVRLQARVVFHQYIMEYPLGKTLEKHVHFYLAQLNYEMQSGRESALDMLQSLINTFPPKILKEFSGQFFVTLGARLVNDEVPICRKMAGECLSSMMEKLSREDRTSLFEIIIVWLKEKKVAHKRLAAQLCGILIMVEKESFQLRIPELMPLILLQFGLNDDENVPGKFVRLVREERNSEITERVKDHHLYQVLQMILKLTSQCPSFLKRSEDIENISVHVQTLLAYPHDWVRLAAAQFLGFVLSSLDIEKLADLILRKEKLESGYLYSNPLGTIKSLALDLCAQLEPNIKPDLAEQVIKNLVFIARVLKSIPINKDRSEDDNNPKINLLWLVKRMRKTVNNEIIENSNSIVLRTEVFKWIAALLTIIEIDTLKPFLHHLLAPLVREMITTEVSNAPLRQLGKEVAGLIKKQIGLEEYTNILNKLQQQLSVKRAERKRSRTQLAVTDPEAYAKKKIKLNEKKKEAKKKKIGKKKGFVKKRTTVDLENDA